ncbi:hypothetical protein KFL_005880010 [Klebsormidium nitens]|uniref:Uncharacterized protein n=1 Tax=Klebsormidium nitens TaxID=105231 RepID=A0A1Y1IPF5_KLENI|nr:hypothetical protein KFL_005880010 [Klebsormidium nitens]|eukprot:GAQ89998.1 hypothetical protein KFL_005880010 [Klebsormidium nitens]
MLQRGWIHLDLLLRAVPLNPLRRSVLCRRITGHTQRYRFARPGSNRRRYHLPGSNHICPGPNHVCARTNHKCPGSLHSSPVCYFGARGNL